MEQLKNLLTMPDKMNQQNQNSDQTKSSPSEDKVFYWDKPEYRREQERISRMQQAEEFFNINFPRKYRNASLDTCDKHPKELIDFFREWAKKPTSLFIIGKYGAGKTHVAFAAIREIVRISIDKPNRYGIFRPSYYPSTELDSILLQASKSDYGDRNKLSEIAEEDLLFIDDLGRETKSDRLKRQYFEILNQRYSEELPTVLTSNYTLEELGDLLDGAVASRIQEWTTIEFKGKDLRKGSN